MAELLINRIKELFDSKDKIYLTLIIMLICILPLFFNLLGLNFDLSALKVNLFSINHPANFKIDERIYSSFSGAFVHTILEWTAFCVALVTVIIAFINYKLTANLLILLIGINLFFAGMMDAFHILATDQFFPTLSENKDFTPFTWFISRFFNSLLILSGTIFLIFKGKKLKLKLDLSVLVLTSIFLGFMAFLIVYSISQYPLPQIVFREQPLWGIITRPYDLIPLVIYIIGAIFVYPRFYKIFPSSLAFTLVLSMVPDIMVQLYMAFGSSALYDNQFNIAHFLKIVTYVCPLCGLLLDYVFIYKSQADLLKKLQNEIMERQKLEQTVLKISNMEQERIGKDLHDSLGQNLTGIAMLTGSLRQNLLNTTNQENIEKMENILQLLKDSIAQSRNFSRILAPLELQSKNMASAIEVLVLQVSQVSNIKCSFLIKGEFPELSYEITGNIYRIIQEALNNSVKHSKATEIIVNIDINANNIEISIQDDGIGFKRENTSDGIGLKLMEYRLASLGARLNIESGAESGTKIGFIVLWRKEGS
jgi:signal transduction histidine kinase